VFWLLASLLLNRQEELEFWGQFLLRIQAITEVQAANAAVGVDLHAERLNVIRAVRASREVAEVKLNLIPSLVEAHGHGANERLHTRGGLVIRRAEAPTDVLVVEHLNLKCEVLLEIFDDHHEEWQLDAEGLVRISGARDEAGVHVAADELEDAGLDILVGEALDVAVPHLLVPDLQWPRSDGVQNRQKAALKRVLEHDDFTTNSVFFFFALIFFFFFFLVLPWHRFLFQ